MNGATRCMSKAYLARVITASNPFSVFAVPLQQALLI